MTPDEMNALRACISEMKGDIDEIKDVVIVLRERSDHAEANCPMRVNIAHIGNGVTEARREAREASTLAMEAVRLARANEISLAKLGVIAGGGGAIGSLVFAVASYLIGGP